MEVKKRIGRSYWSNIWRKFKKNKLAVLGLIFVFILVILGIFAPWLAPYSYDEVHYEAVWTPPCKEFLAGTDQLGRDIFSRLLYSLRNAIFVGFGAQGFIVTVGLVIGLISGFYGGRLDNLLMRIVDIVYAFPNYLLNIILVLVLGRGYFPIFIAISATGWAGMARLVRGQTLSVKNREFVEAARASGASSSRIMFKYILPNIIGPIIYAIFSGIPGVMLLESGLSLIGLGVRPPMPSWGLMISEGTGQFLYNPYMLLAPAGMLVLTLLSFNFVAFGLRDALAARE